MKNIIKNQTAIIDKVKKKSKRQFCLFLVWLAKQKFFILNYILRNPQKEIFYMIICLCHGVCQKHIHIQIENYFQQLSTSEKMNSYDHSLQAHIERILETLQVGKECGSCLNFAIESALKHVFQKYQSQTLSDRIA
jgi:bacterioferritin-associated ferredoxin